MKMRYTGAMQEPFYPTPERGDTSFRTPEEEIEYLRAQVAEKDRQLRVAGELAPVHATAYEVVRAYRSAPPEILADEYRMLASEVEAIVLDLPPEEDDQTMLELMGVVREKGIKNALSVAERMENSHLEDDFHRALVAYILKGYPAPGLKEQTSEWCLLHMTLYEVTLPEPTKQDMERPLKELVSSMEQFYAGMFACVGERADDQRHFTIELAVSGDKEDIVFYVAVPTNKRDLFEKQVLSVFPKARVHEARGDYNIFGHNNITIGARVRLAYDAALPLKDYREFDHDPLSVVVNAFTKLSIVGEGAALQLVINPVGDSVTKRYREVLRKVEKGMKLERALKDTPETFGGEAVKFFKELTGIGEQKKKDEKEDHSLHVDQTLVEELKKKIESPVALVNIRILASAPDAHRAKLMLHDIGSAFSQFENTKGNRLTLTLVEGKTALEYAKDFSFRRFTTSDALKLSLREITTLLHFPTHKIGATPQLLRSRAAVAPAPVGLPTKGTLLGINEFRGREVPAYLADEDRMRHLYVIGQTGTGKTVFLKNLILQDIERGAGVCFIDPHGSDIQDVLANIPEHRLDDVVYFDPADTEHVLSLNMLEYDPRHPEQKTFVVNELLSIFRKLYGKGNPEAMGPAFEQYFRNSTLLVMEDPATGNTLLDISRVFADARYRELKLSRCKNPVVIQFWRDIASKTTGDQGLANYAPYITNKFDTFTSDEIMRPIISMQESSFRLREIMDSKKILLVNLSKGRLGEGNAHLLGLVLVGKILMAALSRVDASFEERPPFYLYIDEFQNVTTDSISAILSEARKYQLSLNIAHQFLAQIEDEIRDAVFGNVGSMAVFRVGAEDAEVFEKQFQPIFDSQDIMNIENRHCYVKLLAGGIPQQAFSIKVPPPRRGSPERGTYAVERSRQKYARPRVDVMREIAVRYGMIDVPQVPST